MQNAWRNLEAILSRYCQGGGQLGPPEFILVFKEIQVVDGGFRKSNYSMCINIGMENPFLPTVLSSG